MEGVCDGTMTMADLRSHGDFGIGTFNALDGELVALDGDFYQLRSDGSARLAGDDMRTPFAVVQHFREEKSQAIAGPEGIAELTDRVHALGGSDNYFYAIRVDGRFSGLTVRAVPRQEKPYPPLIEATRKQSVFDLGQTAGSLVGFRFPDFSQGINMPGLHLHFITSDRKHGSHVLDFALESGRLILDHTSDFYLELPEVEGFSSAVLAKDESDDIRRAEGLPD